YSKQATHTMKGRNLDFVFTSFAESFESLDLYLDFAQLEAENVVFDLGAYCGLSTYVFSKAVGPNGKVFAFEPDTDNFKALCQNTQSHSLENVVTVHKRIWSSSKKLLFQQEGNLGSSFVEISGRNSD